MRYLMTILLLLCASVAQAQEHTLILGKTSEHQINLVVCDTEKQALSIVNAQEADGFFAGLAVLKVYNRQVNDAGFFACGVVQTHILATRVVYETTLEFPSQSNVNTVVIEFSANGKPFYGLLADFRVYRGELL